MMLARLCALGLYDEVHTVVATTKRDELIAMLSKATLKAADVGVQDTKIPNMPSLTLRKESYTPLHAAMASGNVAIAQLLSTEFGAQLINCSSSPSGITPIMLLLVRRWPDIAQAALNVLKPDTSLITSDSVTALNVAVATDGSADADLTKGVLSCGASQPATLNAVDKEGYSALHYAAAAGHVAVLDALLSAGACYPDPAAPDAVAMRDKAQAVRARHMASLGMDSAEVEDGKDDTGSVGSDDDDRDDYYITKLLPKNASKALSSSGGGGMGAEGGTNDEDEPRQWLHPIHCAITAGHAQVVRWMLLTSSQQDELTSQHKRVVPLGLVQPTSGDTLLHCAAKSGHLPVLQAVLEACGLSHCNTGNTASPGAVLMEAHNDSCCTPLVDAIAAKQYAAALALLEAGADARAPAPPLLGPDLPDALAMAVSVCQLPLVAALLAKGADPNARNAHGETTFMTACSMGRPELVKALLDAGADAKAEVASTGESALHILAQRSEDGASQDEASCGAGHDAPPRRKVAELLLSAGLDVNARTRLAGHTPVWLASFHGSPRLAVWLAGHGGDPRIKDDGKNPSLKPADAYAAPYLNEARRAYSRSQEQFRAECGSLVSELRKAWAAHQLQAGTAAAGGGGPAA